MIVLMVKKDAVHQCVFDIRNHIQIINIMMRHHHYDDDENDDDDAANPEDHPLCDIRRRASGVCDIRPSCFHNPIILLLLLFIHSLSFY